MGYIGQKLWDLFGKIEDTLGYNRGIYRATAIGYFMGYIWPKVWDILV